jgi:anti-sigma factor RsiW
VDCEHLEPLIEAIADGTLEPGADARAHLEGCAGCRTSLAYARQIEGLLMSREAPVPAATFTLRVMALVENERWRTERIVDLGFNLAMAAGVLTILAGAAGLAWSLGFLSITIDVAALLDALESTVGSRVVPQVETIGLAAMLLTMTLVLWWWAEADPSR